MSETILSCKDVSIRYMIGDFKNIGLKEWILRRLTGTYHVKSFWADRHVSFELDKGDMLGIIGTNGAGKSTLLKAISGIMEPTEGRIVRHGQIAALLELTSGFDGDLTVRENVYLRGAMLGYTRAFMNETYKDIVEFAELKEFEDRSFKQLSSGMKSRIAFSIASLVNPEILILDEVLSVGDGAFRTKSEAKIREVIRSGVTTILVSHSIAQVRALCNKVLWLHKGGMVAFSDDTRGICNAYERFLGSCRSYRSVPVLGLPPAAGTAIGLPQVTVLVTSHRNTDALRTTLNSVLKQRGIRFEVIVISGAEGLDSVGRVVADFPSVIYEKDRKLTRLSEKILRGIDIASGKYLLIIDDDGRLVDDEFLAKGVARLEADTELSFVSGTVRVTDESEKSDVRFSDTAYPILGKLDGLEYFQEFQVGTLPKPRSTCCTVLRKSSVMTGKPLIECSDSSIYLKSLLSGDAYLMPDLVAEYRVWRGSVAKGSGFGYDFKLNVLKQKELLYKMAMGKIRDPLLWWSRTFQMNFEYFNRTATDPSEKGMLARWGLEHAHGSAKIAAYCQKVLSTTKVKLNKP